MKEVINEMRNIMKERRELTKPVINPKMPKMYGQIKIQKQELAVRPVVTKLKSAAHELNNWLKKIVKKLRRFAEQSRTK